MVCPIGSIWLCLRTMFTTGSMVLLRCGSKMEVIHLVSIYYMLLLLSSTQCHLRTNIARRVLWLSRVYLYEPIISGGDRTPALPDVPDVCNIDLDAGGKWDLSDIQSSAKRDVRSKLQVAFTVIRDKRVKCSVATASVLLAVRIWCAWLMCRTRSLTGTPGRTPRAVALSSRALRRTTLKRDVIYIFIFGRKREG